MVFSFCQKENQFFVAYIEIGVCVFFFLLWKCYYSWDGYLSKCWIILNNKTENFVFEFHLTGRRPKK